LGEQIHRFVHDHEPWVIQQNLDGFSIGHDASNFSWIASKLAR
jgi:hypothetical protein